jgi:hypothetical protein
LAGDEALTLSVSPAMSMEPADVIVRVMVAPDASNRAVEVIAESADFYRSSEIALDGDKAARTTSFRYHELPAGDYQVRGVLIGTDGHLRAIVRREFKVMP